MLKFMSTQFGPTNHDDHNATLQAKIAAFHKSGNRDKKSCY